MGIRDWFSCCRGNEEQEDVRTVHINYDKLHEHYEGNATSTTKYNLLTFLPKALFEQYRRVANIYFTLVAGLSLTPYSPVRPYTTFLPLVIVLGVSMIKEAIEDYKRYQQDKLTNNRKVEVYNFGTKQFDRKVWSQVRVGDVVMVERDDQVPADLLFLASDSEEGTCYVETMNLDGETNLKIKKCLDQTKELVLETIHSFKGIVRCELPNSRLYQFTGNLELEPPFVPEAVKLPLSPAAVLLRGCSLRNTKVAYGAVVYAGHDTKIFMNATLPPSKRTQLERTVDKVIFFMFGLLFAFCIIGAIYFGNWTVQESPGAWYLESWNTETQYDPDGGARVGCISFVTSFILYGYLIPISLYVSLEIVKIIQSMVFISRDRDMYHAETDTPALARTSNLNEELGQINTVLSDKTGTLTCNVMEFFKCSINGVSYGSGITEIERANALRKGVSLSQKQEPALDSYRERFFNFYDNRIMGTAWTKAQGADVIEMFFRLLAVCHTVIPDGPADEKEIKYEAESPDESALVVAAKVFGFFFFKRSSTTITVKERTASGVKDATYEVLNVLEFNSTRKRMSVIVRDSNNKLLLFCKGADTVIYERLDHSAKQNIQLKDVTLRHMEEYGSAGLRTLCLAYAYVDPAVYEKWQVKFQEAKTSLQDRDEKLAEVNEEIEKNLLLLGATAIEDKLQDGVPEAISKLAEAGIKLWVLTGDKMETAVNIAFACSLITDDMQQIRVTAALPEVEKLEVEHQDQAAAELAFTKVQEQLNHAQKELELEGSASRDFAMVVDGKALNYGLRPEMKALFLKVAVRCKAVVCCRVSPLQKALVTALVKENGDLTLAIGDGANDVGMIQKADIGVGISGQEGMQAVQNSDFAIAQFRFIVPLLLIHGRWSYKRIARMINFFFYKNLLFGITIFVYNAFAVFSGQIIYNDLYMSLYNVVFTALPPVIIGIMDRDVDKAACLRFPRLYMQGQKNTYFSLSAIVGWLLMAVYQVTILMILIMIGTVPTYAAMKNGTPWTMWAVGETMFTVVVMTVNLQLAMVLEQWTWLHHLAIWGSQLVWFLFIIIYGVFPLYIAGDVYYLFTGVVAPTPQFWLFIILVPAACLLPTFCYRSVRWYLHPDDHQIVAEVVAEELKKAQQQPLETTVSGAESARPLFQSYRTRVRSHLSGRGVPDVEIGSSKSKDQSNPEHIHAELGQVRPAGSSNIYGAPGSRQGTPPEGHTANGKGPTIEPDAVALSVGSRNAAA